LEVMSSRNFCVWAMNRSFTIISRQATGRPREAPPLFRVIWQIRENFERPSYLFQFIQ